MNKKMKLGLAIIAVVLMFAIIGNTLFTVNSVTMAPTINRMALGQVDSDVYSDSIGRLVAEHNVNDTLQAMMNGIFGILLFIGGVNLWKGIKEKRV
jgi:hypothetical protein